MVAINKNPQPPAPKLTASGAATSKSATPNAVGPTDARVGSKADRIADVTSRAAKDTFETTSTNPTFDLFGAAKRFNGVVSVGFRAPVLTDRTTQPEMNPLAPNTPSTRSGGQGNIASDLAAGMDKGATVPNGVDSAARLAAIKQEVEGQIGHHNGPSKSIGDVGFDVGAVGRAVLEGAADGAGEGLAVGVVLSIVSGGTAVEMLPITVVGGAVSGGLWEGAKQVVKELANDEAKAKAKEAGAASGGLGFDHHGNGSSYIEYANAYFGQAAGTQFGLRSAVSTGGADPRKSNPGRDSDTDATPSAPSGPTYGQQLTVPSDPNRTTHNDARADNLMGTTRVAGRVIITDANADSQGVAPGRVKRRNGGLT